jgi:hypothetical protein
MFDREILASQVKADRFPFPCEGDITLAIRNASYALGPLTPSRTPWGSGGPGHGVLAT